MSGRLWGHPLGPQPRSKKKTKLTWLTCVRGLHFSMMLPRAVTAPLTSPHPLACLLTSLPRLLVAPARGPSAPQVGRAAPFGSGTCPAPAVQPSCFWGDGPGLACWVGCRGTRWGRSREAKKRQNLPGLICVRGLHVSMMLPRAVTAPLTSHHPLARLLTKSEGRRER